MSEELKITISEDGRLTVPEQPIIPFIEGDGIGPDIWKASQSVMDAAVEKAYGGKRKIAWNIRMQIYIRIFSALRRKALLMLQRRYKFSYAKNFIKLK